MLRVKTVHLHPYKLFSLKIRKLELFLELTQAEALSALQVTTAEQSCGGPTPGSMIASLTLAAYLKMSTSAFVLQSYSVQFSSVQSLSRARLFATP